MYTVLKDTGQYQRQITTYFYHGRNLRNINIKIVLKSLKILSKFNLMTQALTQRTKTS